MHTSANSVAIEGICTAPHSRHSSSELQEGEGGAWITIGITVDAQGRGQQHRIWAMRRRKALQATYGSCRCCCFTAIFPPKTANSSNNVQRKGTEEATETERARLQTVNIYARSKSKSVTEKKCVIMWRGVWALRVQHKLLNILQSAAGHYTAASQHEAGSGAGAAGRQHKRIYV